MYTSIARSVVSRSLKAGSAALLRTAEFLDQKNLLSKNEQAILNRNAVFKNRHQGKRAFVIANGPSLKNTDLAVLGSELTFVVSGFWKHEAVKLWQPTYYSILDKTFFTDAENIRQFHQDLKDRITDTTYFAPLFRGYSGNLKHGYLPPDRTYYVAAYGAPSATVDLTSLIQGFESVSAFALAQAIYMGCSPIYLLGFDHDYLAHRGIDHHFYEGSAIKGHRNEVVSIAELNPYDRDMESSLRLWANYRSLHKVAIAAGIEIINATSGGYLDVFPRVKYSEIGFRADAPRA
jgi:hypothetical protein